MKSMLIAVVLSAFLVSGAQAQTDPVNMSESGI
jgi:hypothetical protein